MKKKQSSIEWLIEQLKERYSLMNSEPLFDQAKAMHKDEIVKAAAQGYILGADGFPLEVAHHYGQQWYKNQFEGGEDE